jgi:hypothetical protein
MAKQELKMFKNFIPFQMQKQTIDGISIAQEITVPCLQV